MGTEALRAAHGHVGAELTRRDEQRQAQQVGGHHHVGPGRVHALAEVPVVVDGTVGGRILHERPKQVRSRLERPVIPHHHTDAQRLGARLDDRDRLWMTGFRDEERVAGGIAHDAMQHHHGLGGGRRLVEQRGVGQLQPGQVDDHGLEIQKRFQPTLSNLRLIGRIGRVPGRILQHIALNDRRRDRVVVAHSDERAERGVLCRQFLQPRQQLGLAECRRKRQRPLRANGRRDRLIHQLLQRRKAQRLQHLLDLRRRRADVPLYEPIGKRQIDSHSVVLHFIKTRSVNV